MRGGLIERYKYLTGLDRQGVISSGCGAGP